MSKRLEFIDVARGFAVLLMVMWHSADAWVRTDLRSGASWTALVYLGGMAAPLFTSLAGVAGGLRAHRAADRPFDAAVMRGQVGRGLEILVLGYALRMQMWMIDGGGLVSGWGWQVWVPGTVAILLALAAAKRLEATPKTSAWQLALAVALYTFALLRLGATIPERPYGLMRVDILQCIGASLIITALLERALGAKVGRALVLAAAAAILAPYLERALPGVLPRPVAAYLARWPSIAGERPLAGFPLFPWIAYAFIGRAVGLTIATHKAQETLGKAAAFALAIGALLSVGANETLQWKLGTMSALPDIVYVVRVLARVGNLLFVLGLTYFATGSERVRTSFVWALGQSSLFVYWVHMEFAYGIASKPIKLELDLGEWFAAFASLMALMVALVYVKRTKRVDAWLDRGERLLDGKSPA